MVIPQGTGAHAVTVTLLIQVMFPESPWHAESVLSISLEGCAPKGPEAQDGWEVCSGSPSQKSAEIELNASLFDPKSQSIFYWIRKFRVTFHFLWPQNHGAFVRGLFRGERLVYLSFRLLHQQKRIRDFTVMKGSAYKRFPFLSNKGAKNIHLNSEPIECSPSFLRF